MVLAAMVLTSRGLLDGRRLVCGADPPPDRGSAMSEPKKTAIVTGASQGIGAGVVKAFRQRGFNVVATAPRRTSESREVEPGDSVVHVDGDIGLLVTAARIVEAALTRFGSIDALVNNAGIFISRPFISTAPRTGGRSPPRTSRASST
jgi:NAD(P)-dependent dehydrogenase (short-subunit alcohol dehydrogenase family)